MNCNLSLRIRRSLRHSDEKRSASASCSCRLPRHRRGESEFSQALQRGEPRRPQFAARHPGHRRGVCHRHGRHRPVHRQRRRLGRHAAAVAAGGCKDGALPAALAVCVCCGAGDRPVARAARHAAEAAAVRGHALRLDAVSRHRALADPRQSEGISEQLRIAAAISRSAGSSGSTIGGYRLPTVGAHPHRGRGRRWRFLFQDRARAATCWRSGATRRPRATAASARSACCCWPMSCARCSRAWAACCSRSM